MVNELDKLKLPKGLANRKPLPFSPSYIASSGGLLKSLFDANTFLYATADNTPLAKTRAEIMAILSGQAASDFSMNSKKITSVTDPTAAQDAATKNYVDTNFVADALFDAYTMLYADTDNTPAALAIAASRIVGRKSSGGIAALTGAEVLAILSGQAAAAFDLNSQNLTGLGDLTPGTDDQEYLGSNTLGWKGLYLADLKIVQASADTLSLEQSGTAFTRDLQLRDLLFQYLTGIAASSYMRTVAGVTGKIYLQGWGSSAYVVHARLDPDNFTLVNGLLAGDLAGGGYSVLNVTKDLEHHTAGDTLTKEESGSVHTNLGATGSVTLTLPQDAVAGTHFWFVVMAAQKLKIDPGAAGGIYFEGSKRNDDLAIYADDEGESVLLVCDGNNDWAALFATGTWNIFSWYSDWEYRIKLTIDKDLVDSALTDFPVLVKLTSGELDFSHANADGYDIRFTSSDGETLLKYERERYDNGSEVAEFWVKIPSVSNTADTEFYMYYTTADKADGEDAANVWDSDFEAVWHMNAAGGANETDSKNSRVLVETSGTIDSSTGKAGLARDIEASDTEYFSIADAAWQTPAAFTIEFTVAPEVVTANLDWFTKWNATGNQRCFIIRQASATWTAFVSSDGSAMVTVTANGATAAIDTWENIALTWDGSTVKMYINGAVQTDTEALAALKDSSAAMIVGTGAYLANYADGDIDEVRFSKVDRGAAWLKANHNSVNDTLLTYGAEES